MYRLTEMMNSEAKMATMRQQTCSMRMMMIIITNSIACTATRKVKRSLVVQSFSTAGREMRRRRQQVLTASNKFTIIASIILRFIYYTPNNHYVSFISSSQLYSSSRFKEDWSIFSICGFTIFVAFLPFTSSLFSFPYTTQFSFYFQSATNLRMGVTLLLRFFMIRGWPQNCSILQVSSSFTFSTAAKLVNYPQQFGAEKIVSSFFSQPNSQPSSTTWWERQMRSNSFLLRKRSITFFPQQQLIPRQKLSLQPSVLGFGSDHKMSETTLLPFGSTGLFMLFKEEMFLMRGLSPPCTQKMRLDTTAAMGKKLKVSDTIFHDLRESLLLHSSQKPQSLLSSEDQWLPLSRKKLVGYLILQAMRRQMHSSDCLPRSTQSPRKRQFLFSGEPNSLKMVSKSLNWPCVSPQIWMGAYSSSSMG